MKGLFVTATDTGVGKTEVACAIVRGARAAGLDVGAMKPAQSGVVAGEPSDAELLRAAAGGGDPLELVCPYTFEPPLAPGVAARLAGVEVAMDRLVDAARALSSRHAALVVEGAGGLMTPLTSRDTYADLAWALGLPALVVARAGLGTLNHTALTVEALRMRGVEVVGVVLNRATPATDPSEAYNAAEIARRAGVRIVASLPFLPDRGERARALETALAGKIQF